MAFEEEPQTTGPDKPAPFDAECHLAEMSIWNNPNNAVWFDQLFYQLLTGELTMNRPLAISVNLAVHYGVEQEYRIT